MLWTSGQVAQQRVPVIAVVDRNILRTLLVGERLRATREVPHQTGVALVGQPPCSALIEHIALSLQTGDRRGVGISGAEIQKFAVLARHIGVQEAEVLVEALVYRRSSSRR
jgi:hypothetical protein